MTALLVLLLGSAATVAVVAVVQATQRRRRRDVDAFYGFGHGLGLVPERDAEVASIVPLLGASRLERVRGISGRVCGVPIRLLHLAVDDEGEPVTVCAADAPSGVVTKADGHTFDPARLSNLVNQALDLHASSRTRAA